MNSGDVSTALASVLPGLTSFLCSSRIVCLAFLDDDGVVDSANTAFADCLQVADGDMAGRRFQEFLTEADRGMFARCLEGKESFPDGEFLLNVVDAGQVPHSLYCRLTPFENGLLLLAEPSTESDGALQGELLQINNRLTVLSRENSRKGRELEKALAELKRVHDELDSSHWHLRKIQEVLPICMECGKVNTSDSSWEDVVTFLKNNSLFLSHGYCPDCGEKVKIRWQKSGKGASGD